MPKFKDLAGETFGILRVRRRDPAPGEVRWECLCGCGNVRIVMARNLVSGASRSCGCRRNRVARKVKRTPSTSGNPKWTAEDQAETDRILGERPPIPVPKSTPAPVRHTPPTLSPEHQAAMDSLDDLLLLDLDGE